MTRVVVFDHDSGRLQRLALPRAVCVVTTDSGDAKDEQAVRLLKLDRVAGETRNPNSWEVALLHVHDEPWQDLCAWLPAGRAIIRFSTQGFAPKRPYAGNGLALCCTRRIKDLTEDDLPRLVSAVTDATIAEALRKGTIPATLRDLIAFGEPHTLRRLYIVLLGVLSTWAADPADPAMAEARRALEVDDLAPPPTRELATSGGIRRALGVDGVAADAAFRSALASELGEKSLDAQGPIGLLVAALFETNQERPDTGVVVNAFALLDSKFEDV
jgi:hypothetical protein